MIWTLVLGMLGLGASVLLRPTDSYYQGWHHSTIVYGCVALGIYLVNKLKLTFIDVLCVALGALAIYGTGVLKITPQITLPNITIPDKPAPKRLFPWFGDVGAFVESADGVGPGGLEVMTDLPAEYRKHNISSSGLGCCVFRSADHAAHWQNIECLWGMPEWMVENRIAGGGYPEKVDKLVPQMAKAKGAATPPYRQHTEGDPKFLERELANGYMICVTYNGRDNRYKSTIAHMVNLVYLDATAACILDNNYVDKYLWMSREEFLSRWNGGAKGWAYVFDVPGPPPIPRN